MSRRDAEAVWARASELQAEGGAVLSRERVEQVARDLGVDPLYVEQAIRERGEAGGAVPGSDVRGPGTRGRSPVAGLRLAGMVMLAVGVVAFSGYSASASTA